MNSHHYTESGLQNVYIDGLVPFQDDAGDWVITIPAINELHAVIALGIVSHEHGITGDELRFLRTEMGMTQAELAEVVHHDKQAIGRWERGEYEIDSKAEAIIRRHAIETLGLEAKMSMQDLSRRSVPTVKEQPINIEMMNDNGAKYRLLAA